MFGWNRDCVTSLWGFCQELLTEIRSDVGIGLRDRITFESLSRGGLKVFKKPEVGGRHSPDKDLAGVRTEEEFSQRIIVGQVSNSLRLPRRSGHAEQAIFPLCVFILIKNPFPVRRGKNRGIHANAGN